MEKAQKIFAPTSQRGRKHRTFQKPTHLCEPMSGEPSVEDRDHDGRQNEGNAYGADSQLPRPFPLPGPRIHLHHQEDDIEGGNYVEELEKHQVKVRPSA